VRVIAAHCGTHARPFEKDYLGTFVRMAHEHEHFYGDTAALNLPTRSHAYRTIFEDDVVRKKLVHGSDWPILPVPPMRIGLTDSIRGWRDTNWLRRDVKIKQQLGFDEEYWHRAGRLLLKRDLAPTAPTPTDRPQSP
jgi:hypothetical protein